MDSSLNERNVTQDQLEDVAKQWSEQDAEAYATRIQLLDQMANLRTINEYLSVWANDLNSKWDELNVKDKKTHNERLEWNRTNVGAPSSYVPTMMNFNNSAKVGFDSLNEKPHWFDTLCASSGASRIAWEAIKSGEMTGVDKSTVGGVAVDGLFKMLQAAKNTWKAPVSVAGSRPAPFNWNSHGYSASEKKQDVESKLGLHEPDVTSISQSLPREYSNDIQCYIRTALDTSSGLCADSDLGANDHANAQTGYDSTTAEHVSTKSSSVQKTNDRLSRMKLSSSSSALTNKKSIGLSVTSVTSNGSWWSGPHWST